jgi:alkaline phosphatase D
MIKLSFLLLTTLLILSNGQNIIQANDPDHLVLAFGSCNQHKPSDDSSIFQQIINVKPDVWVWLGDVAYVDYKVLPMLFTYPGETKILNKFMQAKNNPEYIQLRNSTNVIGVWNSHDYGINNGGKFFQHKTLTQQLWLDFIDEPHDSPRRKREGIYESYYLGDKTKVKVILLDIRYSRDEESVLGHEGDELGAEQWKWLEEELKNNDAKFTLIGSGTQILPDDRIVFSSWYLNSRQRLFDLIKKHKKSGVLLISGDVHYSEIMKYPCRERIGYDLHEITSSGLTHHVADVVPSAGEFINSMFPDTYNTDEDRYFERNFAVLRFDFNEEKPQLKVEIRNKYGKIVLERELDYAKMTFDGELVRHKAQCVLDQHRFGRIMGKIFESILDFNFYPLVVIFGSIFLILSIVYVEVALRGIVKWIGKKVFPNGKRRGRSGSKHNQGTGGASGRQANAPTKKTE